MKVGKIGLIPYGKPGSDELFASFRDSLDTGDAYILKNHGGIVGGKSLMDAFFGIEELEVHSIRRGFSFVYIFNYVLNSAFEQPAKLVDRMGRDIVSALHRVII